MQLPQPVVSTRVPPTGNTPASLVPQSLLPQSPRARSRLSSYDFLELRARTQGRPFSLASAQLTLYQCPLHFLIVLRIFPFQELSESQGSLEEKTTLLCLCHTVTNASGDRAGSPCALSSQATPTAAQGKSLSLRLHPNMQASPQSRVAEVCYTSLASDCPGFSSRVTSGHLWQLQWSMTLELEGEGDILKPH